MWYPDACLAAFNALDLSLRSPAVDVRVYLSLDNWDFDAGVLATFEDCEELDRVEVGTWDSVFAGTVGFSSLPSAALVLPWFEGVSLTWENDREVGVIPRLWFVLNRTVEQVFWFKPFSIPGDNIAPGGKFHFRPQIRGRAISGD